jgi:hypothetical protein
MDMEEDKFRKIYGHSSLCNCIRLWKGRYYVTRRRCDCGVPLKSWADRRAETFAQAQAELGELCADNLKAIQARIKELEKESRD